MYNDLLGEPERKAIKVESTKYLLRRIGFLKNSDSNDLFNEMKATCDEYNEQVRDQIYNNDKIQYSNFKSNFFKNLENLLHQITLIKDKKIKLEKTKRTYEFYKNKRNWFDKIKEIRSKTHKLNYQREIDPNKIPKNKDYIAQNFPRGFEFDNRTDHGIPPRDKLKEFDKKSIMKEQKRKEEENKASDIDFIKIRDYEDNVLNTEHSNNDTQSKQAKQEKKLSSKKIISNIALATAENFHKAEEDAEDKLRRTFQSTTGFRSTQYTVDPNSSTEKFFSNIKHNNYEDSKKEIKSSYISYKPKVDFQTFNLEKLWTKKKFNEMQDKRHKEEEAEFIHNFKMRYAESREYRDHTLDTRKVLAKYESDIINHTGDLNLMSEDSVTAARNRILSKDKNLMVKSSKRVIPDSPDNNETTTKNENNEKREFEVCNSKQRLVSKDNIKNLKIIMARKIAVSNKQKLPKKEEVETIQTTEAGDEVLISDEDIKEVMHTKETNDTIVINDNSLKKNLTCDDNLIQLDKSNKEFTLSADITAKGILENKLFRTRKLYGTLSNLSEFKPAREKNEYLRLSKYDPSNQNFLDFNNLRPMTQSTIGKELEKNPETETNLLDMRRNMAKYKSHRDIMRIKTSLSKNKINIPMTKLKKAFQCPDNDYVYNAAFLPSNNGYGLMDRTVTVVKKK